MTSAQTLPVDYTDTVDYELETWEGRDVPVRQSPGVSMVLGMRASGYKPCPDCGGTGGSWPYIEGQECPACDEARWVKITPCSANG